MICHSAFITRILQKSRGKLLQACDIACQVQIVTLPSLGGNWRARGEDSILVFRKYFLMREGTYQ